MVRVIPFKDTVSASSEKTAVSKRIPFPYLIKNVKIYFPPGSELLTQYKIFVAGDDSAPATGEPSGDNVFGTLGQVSYFVGDNSWIDMDADFLVQESNTFLKVYINNTDSWDHTLICLITLLQV